MPTFIQIGRHDGNLSGNTFKGYFISRTSKSVTVKFGAIHSVNRKYYWAGHNLPIVKVRKFKTEKEAIGLYNDRMRRRRKEGYSQLRSDTRIYTRGKLDRN